MSSNDSVTNAAPDDAPDVFLSYSRKDQALVLRLAAALEAAGWGVWVDTEDIPATAEWGEELAVGIRTAHTFVFLISPDSVRSEYCRRELEQAAELGKRLVPVVLRDAEGVPQELASRQYIFLREDDFDGSVATLTTALATNLELVREHRQWLTAALRWDEAGRDRGLLVRGRSLKAGEDWLARQAGVTEPRPTRVQTEFLLASRKAETRRLRAIIAAVAVALAVAILLGVLALLQRNAARKAAAIARSRELAIASGQQLALDPERSLLLAIEAVKARTTAEAGNALRTAVSATRLRAEIPVPGQTVRSLVSDVAFSPGGNAIAAALENGEVGVAGLAQRPPRLVLLPVPALSADDPCTTFTSGQGATRIAFSPDGRLLAAAGDRSWILLWTPARPGKPVTSPFCLGYTGPPPVTATVSSLAGGSSVGMTAVTFAGNDAVVAAEETGTIVRWRWAGRAPPEVARASRLPNVAAAFSGRGHSVALAEDSGVGVWAPGRGAYASLAVGGVTAVAVDADGGLLAAARGSSIGVWRPGAARLAAVLTTHDTVRSIAVSRDGRFVAAGGQAGAVSVWTVAHPGPPVVLTVSSGPVTAVAFSSDGSRVLSGGDDGVLRVWAWDPGRFVSPLAAAGPSGRVSMADDGRLVTAEAADPHRVWVELGGHPRVLDDVPDPTALSLSRTGLRAVAPANGGIRAWDLSGTPRVWEISADRKVHATALSPDGRTIASGEDGRLRVLQWPGKSETVLEQSRLFGPGYLVYTAAAFSPDGKRLASAGYNGKISEVAVWDLRASKRAFQFVVPGYVPALAFSPDATKLVAPVSDGTVRVWDLDDGSLTVLRGHHGTVGDAAFSPDGKELVSGGAGDGTVRVWELAEGDKSVGLPGLVGDIGGVAFTPDGRAIEAAGTAGAREWPCDFCGSIGDVLSNAEALTVRSLTPEERAQFLHRR